MTSLIATVRSARPLHALTFLVVLGVLLVTALVTAAPAAAAPDPSINETLSYADISNLPAWRWSTVYLDNDGGGFLSNPLDQFPAAIGALLLMVAGAIWQVLLTVFRIGLSGQDLLQAASGPINYVFGWIGSNLLAFSAVFWGLAMLRMFKQLVTFDWIKLIKSAFAFALLFAFLSVTAVASLNASTIEDPAARMEAKGTMPWIAATVVDVANRAVAPLTAPILAIQDNATSDLANSLPTSEEGSGLASTVDSVAAGAQAAVAVKGQPPTCAAYISALEQRYSEAKQANQSLLVASRLWKNTFYESWQASQFGVSPSDGAQLPDRAMCHWAEAANGIPAADQTAVLTKAYLDSPIAIKEGAPVLGPTFAGKDEMRSAATAWAACEFVDGAWKVSAAYKNVKDPVITDANCSATFADGSADLTDKGPFFIFGDNVGDRTGGADAATIASSEDARNFGNAMTGINGWDRVIQGAVAIIVALLFLYALGSIALGLLFAQLVAIVALMFAIPAAFVLYAIGMNKQGMRMLRITLTTTLSQIMFTVLLSALILMSGLFQGLATYIELPGVFGAMVFGLAPLAAFFALRMLLKSMGLGDIMSVAGGLSFATAASLSATGDKKLQAMARPAQGANGKDRGSALTRGLGKVPFFGRGIQGLDSKLHEAPSRFATKMDRTANGAKKRKDLAAQDARARKKKDDALDARIAERKDTPWGRAMNRLDRSLKSDSETRKRVRDAFSTPGRKAASSVKDKLKDDFRKDFSNFMRVTHLPAAFQAIRSMARTRLDGGASARNALDNLNRVASVTSPSNSWSAHAASLTDEEREALPETAYAKAGTLDAQDSAQAVEQAFPSFAQVMEVTKTPVGGNTVDDVRAQRMARFMDEFQEARWGTRGEVFTPDELQAMRNAFAEAHDLPMSRVAITAGGLAMEIPLSGDKFRIEGTLDDAQYFANWLPAHVREYQTIERDGVRVQETPQEYAARMYTIGLAGGWLSPDGTKTDVLAALGIDLNNDDVRKEFAAWQKGAASDLFSSIKLEVPDSAMLERAVEASYAVVRAQDMTMRVTIDQQVASIAAEAEKSITTLNASAAEAAQGLSDLAQRARAVEGSRAEMSAATDDASRQQAAMKLSVSTDELEVMLDQALERMTDVFARSAEAQAASAAVLSDSFEEFSKVLEHGLGDMADITDEVEEAVRGLKNGSKSFTEVAQVLTKAATQVTSTGKKAEESVEAAVKSTVDEHVKKLAESTPRRPAVYEVRGGQVYLKQDGRAAFPTDTK